MDAQRRATRNLDPGKNQKRYLAAALDPATGQTYYVLGPKKNNALFRKLLDHLQQSFGKRYRKIYVVCDNYRIHKSIDDLTTPSLDSAYIICLQ